MSARAISRRHAVLACGALMSTQLRTASAAPALLLTGLRWTGARPTFPSFRAVAQGAFTGEVEVRIATRADPLRYKAHLAFSRLATVLQRPLTPRSEAYAIRLPDLLSALERDAAGLALVRDEMAILNDGTVTVLVSDAVRGREVDFSGAELRPLRTWSEATGGLPAAHRTLVGAYVDTLILDYLAGNARRSTVLLSSDGARLWLVDNGGAFVERIPVGALDALLGQLRRVTRFSRTFVERLQTQRRPDYEALLHAGPFANWLVASRPISEMLERSRVVQSLVAARTAELGAQRALALP